jgi:hypothetical protein
MSVPKPHTARLSLTIVAGVTAGCSLLLEDGYSSNMPVTPTDAGALDQHVPSDEADAGDAAPAVKRRPDEGVYVYLATGKDSISFGPATANYGPTASVEVVHSDPDCFAATLALRSDYTEATEFCVRGDQTVRLGMRRRQRFAILGGIDVFTVMTCQPGDPMTSVSPEPAQEWAHVCSGSNDESETGTSSFTSEGPYRFMGEEDVIVGGVAVRSRHFHEELMVSGLQQGTNVVDWYFAADGGMLVRFVRKTLIRYPQAFDAAYTEDADLTLASMTPTPVPRDAGADAASKN